VKNIQIYADGAELNGILDLYQSGLVSGFTTNPTLMKKVGITDYAAFAKSVLSHIKDLPFSFEVFSDDFLSMEREARIIASWGPNVFVKIPITNTKGESSVLLIEKLSKEGLNLNITAMMTIAQVRSVLNVINPKAQTIISVFAGRVADTGIDPIPLMREVAEMCRDTPGALSLWASTRELLNILQAEACGVNIITVTHDILGKLKMVGKDLDQLSLETVKMFYNDALSSGFSLE
jgi:transaldolase